MLYGAKKGRALVVTFGILVFLTVLIYWIGSIRETSSWLSQFKKEIEQGVASARIEFGDFPVRRNNVICEITSKDDLKAMMSYLRDADLIQKRGHVIPLLAFEMELQLVSGVQPRYLGWIYDGHPNDVFIERTLWHGNENGTYKRNASTPIRIPNAASWIRQTQKRCISTRG